MNKTNHLFVTGASVGHQLLTNYSDIFNPQRPFAACLICGAVYQTQYDRLADPDLTPEVQHYADNLRKEWRTKHARSHPSHKHESLKKSGNMMTPEAANKLAEIGLISLTDLVLSNEVEFALLEAHPSPYHDGNNIEGG